MGKLSQTNFLKTMPEAVIPHLPAHLGQKIQTRQPWRWLIQFHFGETRLHYEISPISKRDVWELGFHWEAGDTTLNRYLLTGFRRHLFEIKAELGARIEAEMWDKGWAKIYEVYPSEELITEFQAKVGARMAQMITSLHPIYVRLRQDVARVHR
jgi:hypothetical protein